MDMVINRNIILGTAGHIDHGKTSLVKALTGVDCDRLKEEKERGITIELGFASLDLPDGARLGVIDVPGHERFVKNMVAGAAGIDLVLLVIAADEGIMPQTKEHLEICSFLGIPKGLIALTKIDLVDEEWLEMVKEDVQNFLKGSFLESSPIIPLSVKTGEGLEDLISQIQEMVKYIKARPSWSPMRLPIDRVFTLKGMGTVVTGTLISGEISLGEEVEVLPKGLSTRVRGLQIHNEKVDKATAGVRTAANLQGMGKEAIDRGDTLTHPGELEPSFMLDVYAKILPDFPRPIKDRTRTRVHLNTSEIMGRIILLGKEKVLPGEEAFFQIRLEEPVVAVFKDRFILRSLSPVTTIGGGEVLDPLPQKHKKHAGDGYENLIALEEANPKKVVQEYFKRVGINSLGIKDLRKRTGFSREALEEILNSLHTKGEIIALEGEGFVHKETFDKLKHQMLTFLKDYHKNNPLKDSVSKEEIKSKIFPFLDPKEFMGLLKQLKEKGEIEWRGDLVCLGGFRPMLSQKQQEIAENIKKIYFSTGLTPPSLKEIQASHEIKEEDLKGIMGLLTNEGILVKVAEDLYFHKDWIQRLKEKLSLALKEEGKIDPSRFKEITGASRKYSIPLLEFFDKIKFTVRQGNYRVLATRKDT